MLIIDMPMPKEKYVNVRIFADGTATVSTDEKPYYKEMSVSELVRCSECRYDGRCMFQSFVIDNSRDEIPYDRNTFYCADGKENCDE